MRYRGSLLSTETRAISSQKGDEYRAHCYDDHLTNTRNPCHLSLDRIFGKDNPLSRALRTAVTQFQADPVSGPYGVLKTITPRLARAEKRRRIPGPFWYPFGTLIDNGKFFGGSRSNAASTSTRLGDCNNTAQQVPIDVADAAITSYARNSSP